MTYTTESALEARAAAFAQKAHESINQRRKGSGEPYITHPAGVVEILKGWGVHDEFSLSAAWLHDVVEDTPVTLREILNEFGPIVAGMVAALTQVSKPSDGTRALRVAMDREHLAKADSFSQDIKLADILHNTRNIVKVSPHFAPVWIPEKLADLKVLNLAYPLYIQEVRVELLRALAEVNEVTV